MNDRIRATVYQEISLADVIGFVLRNWIIILGTGVLGAIAAIVLVSRETPVYESTAAIQIVQVNGVGAESITLLAARLRYPGSYTNQTVEGCGLSRFDNAGELLMGMVNITPLRDLPSTAELKVRGDSPDRSRRCAEAIVEMIQKQHQARVEEMVEPRGRLLANLEKQITAGDAIIAEALEKPDGRSIIILAKMREIQSLRSRADELRETILSSLASQTHLIAPVYASVQPVPRSRVRPVMTAGVAGMGLGFVLALIFEAWKRRRKGASESTAEIR